MLYGTAEYFSACSADEVTNTRLYRAGVDVSLDFLEFVVAKSTPEVKT